LSPGTAYIAKLSASNECGTADGPFAPFTTLTVVQAIEALIQQVQSLGLSRGLEKSLVKKLQAAVDTITDDNPENDKAAEGQLTAFLNEVCAQCGKQISEDTYYNLYDRACTLSMILPN